MRSIQRLTRNQDLQDAPPLADSSISSQGGGVQEPPLDLPDLSNIYPTYGGTHQNRENERERIKRLSGVYDRAAFQSEHPIGFGVVSDLPRRSAEGKRFLDQMPAYQELTKLHEIHAGTFYKGMANEEHRWPIYKTYRSDQRATLFDKIAIKKGTSASNAYQLNQLDYGHQLSALRSNQDNGISDTSIGFATNSFNVMVSFDPEIRVPRKNKRDKIFRLGPKGQTEAVLARWAATNGVWPSLQLEDRVSRHFVDSNFRRKYPSRSLSRESSVEPEISNSAVGHAARSNRQVVLDFETTGLDTEKDKIIEIGCVELVNGRSGKTYQTLVNAGGTKITSKAFKVHRISDADLTRAPSFDQVVDDFIDFIGESSLIAHNGNEFDFKLLNRALKAAGRPAIDASRLIDTLEIDRRMYPDARHKLDHLCARYNVAVGDRSRHRALDDAKLLADVYCKMYPTAREGSNEFERAEGGGPWQRYERMPPGDETPSPKMTVSEGFDLLFNGPQPGSEDELSNHSEGSTPEDQIQDKTYVTISSDGSNQSTASVFAGQLSESSRSDNIDKHHPPFGDRPSVRSSSVMVNQQRNSDFKARKTLREVVIMVEATGFDASSDRIIEVGCVELLDRSAIGKKFHRYINPGQREENYNVNGLNSTILENEPYFRYISKQLLNFIGDSNVVTSNGTEFVLPMLNREFEIAGNDKEIHASRMVDIYKIAALKHPDQLNTLNALFQRYPFITPREDRRVTLKDAVISASVYIGLQSNERGVVKMQPGHTPQSSNTASRILKRKRSEPELSDDGRRRNDFAIGRRLQSIASESSQLFSLTSSRQGGKASGSALVTSLSGSSIQVDPPQQSDSVASSGRHDLARSYNRADDRGR